MKQEINYLSTLVRENINSLFDNGRAAHLRSIAEDLSLTISDKHHNQLDIPASYNFVIDASGKEIISNDNNDLNRISRTLQITKHTFKNNNETYITITSYTNFSQEVLNIYPSRNNNFHYRAVGMNKFANVPNDYEAVLGTFSSKIDSVTSSLLIDLREKVMQCLNLEK
jgi:hypothetical protein